MTKKNRLYNERKILLTALDDFIKDPRQFEIARLGQLALTSDNTESFMKEVVKVVQKSLEVDFVKILELSEDQTKLKLIIGVGWKPNIVGNAFVDVDYTSQAGYTLINKKPVVVPDFKFEKRFLAPQLLLDHNVISGMSITIPGKERPFGILGAHSSRPIEFTEADVSFLHSVSFILSSFIIQQKAIIKLREEETKYRTLMEYASDAIFIFDKEGNIIDANSKACEMSGYLKKELLKKNIKDLYKKKDLENIPLQLDEVIKGKQAFIERRLVKKDNSIMHVEVSPKLLPNSTIQGIYRDITTRKEKEELIRNIQKMEAISRFSGGLAHDFNNYLTVIIGYSDKLINSLENSKSEEIINDINQIKMTGEKASLLTKELLNFSRKKFYESEIISINDLVQDLDKSIVSFLGESIKLKYSLDGEIDFIKANPNQLQQSILNLVINAKDASRKSGTITIKTFNYSLHEPYTQYAFEATPGEYVAISVSDTGVGITDEIKSHLFEPFFTTKQEKGTGLGLASIYGFIREFDGFVTVKSEINEGTTFTLYLKSFYGTNSIIKERKKHKKIQLTNNIKTILLVEDNAELNELINKILTKKDFKVYSVNNGKDALNFFLSHKKDVDLLITDIIMPEMDGFELLKELHKKGIEKKTILISGYSIKDPKSMNCTERIKFLQKPFSIEHLLQTINTL